MIASMPLNPLPQASTPAAIVDARRMEADIARMQTVAQRRIDAGASGITVSALKEARQFFAAGVKDILYAVGISPNKFAAALDLRLRGCELKLLS